MSEFKTILSLGGGLGGADLHAEVTRLIVCPKSDFIQIEYDTYTIIGDQDSPRESYKYTLKDGTVHASRQGHIIPEMDDENNVINENVQVHISDMNGKLLYNEDGTPQTEIIERPKRRVQEYTKNVEAFKELLWTSIEKGIINYHNV